MERLGLSSRAIIGRFYQTLEQALAGSWMTPVSMYFTSDQASEVYKWLGMSPAMREWIGGREAKGLRSNGFEIKNKDFEATLEISVKDLRRDKTGQILVRIDEMADRAAQHWEELGSALLLNGHAALCYDGHYFFDTDHSEGDSGVQKNLLTASEVPDLNVGTATAPTPYEMAKAIMGVIGYMYSFKDDQGKPINGGARAFLVKVPVAFWSAAITAASSAIINTGTGSIDNPLQGAFKAGISIQVVANPLLTWTTDFAVLRMDGRAKPFIRQEEEGIQMAAVAEGSELEFNEDKHHYGIKTSRNAGYGLWQHAAKATLS